MKQILTQTRVIDAGSRQLTICYDLEEDDMEGLYGVQLRDTDSGETARVTALTANWDTALRFYERLLRGAVTPMTLREVAEDFVAEL